MKLKSLTHPRTPDRLQALNADIESILHQDDVDSEKLLALISDRELLISEHLSSLNAADKKQFSVPEVEINNYLISIVSDLGKQTLIDATVRIRQRKAAKKYLE